MDENEIEEYEYEYVESPAKEFFRKVAIFAAIIGIVASIIYIAYEVAWVPRHFKKLSEVFDSINYSDVQDNFIDFKKQYPDYAGQFIVKGLDMDFPVTQRKDNKFYLTHTIDGKLDKHGALFADCENNLKVLNPNTVIYGHNMKDNSQFGMLNVYKTANGYKAGPVVTFNTIYANYKWKVFASFLINTNPKDDEGYAFNYTRKEFANEAEFDTFYREVMKRSYIITGVDVEYGDKILTMSTCSVLYDDSRLVVMARLVRDGESEDVDLSAAHNNKNQRFPAAFDKER